MNAKTIQIQVMGSWIYALLSDGTIMKKYEGFINCDDDRENARWAKVDKISRRPA